MAAALASPSAVQKIKPLKVAFVYIGPPGDLGWTYEHEQARKAVANRFGGRVRLDYIENVPVGPVAESVVRQFAIDGYDLIFATSFGYMDTMLAVAKDFPEVKFEHCSGHKTAPNMSSYFGKIEEARYLSGIIAGKMTKAAKIGYVAAFRMPEVIRGINAFALGVRSVNPRAAVLVEWTDSWYDPAKERAAATALLDAGVDIIAQHSDTTEPQLAARERGKLSIGYDSDMGAFVGESVLVSAVWNWEVYYADAIQKALDGTWSSRSYWGGLREGIVALSSISPRVPKDVVAQVERARKSIVGGKLDIFSGPINGQDGKIKVEAKTALTDDQELTMDWFVQGVIGEPD